MIADYARLFQADPIGTVLILIACAAVSVVLVALVAAWMA